MRSSFFLCIALYGISPLYLFLATPLPRPCSLLAFAPKAMSTSIPPFAKHAPPPRPIIVLLCATDLDDGVDRLAPLLVHNDLNDKRPSRSLGASRQRSSTPGPRYHPYRQDDGDTARPASYSREGSSPLSSPAPSEDEDTGAANGMQSVLRLFSINDFGCSTTASL